MIKLTCISTGFTVKMKPTYQPVIVEVFAAQVHSKPASPQFRQFRNGKQHLEHVTTTVVTCLYSQQQTPKRTGDTGD